MQVQLRGARLVRALALLSTLVAASGCASVLGSKQADFQFNTNPQAAQVFVDGAPMGSTPLKVKLSNTKAHTITFKKEGYQDTSCQLDRGTSGGWVILDVLMGLVPVIIDAATNNWSQTKSHACTQTLTPTAGAVADASHVATPMPAPSAPVAAPPPSAPAPAESAPVAPAPAAAPAPAPAPVRNVPVAATTAPASLAPDVAAAAGTVGRAQVLVWRAVGAPVKVRPGGYYLFPGAPDSVGVTSCAGSTCVIRTLGRDQEVDAAALAPFESHGRRFVRDATQRLYTEPDTGNAISFPLPYGQPVEVRQCAGGLCYVQTTVSRAAAGGTVAGYLSDEQLRTFDQYRRLASSTPVGVDDSLVRTLEARMRERAGRLDVAGYVAREALVADSTELIFKTRRTRP
jgi:hypothetical protein